MERNIKLNDTEHELSSTIDPSKIDIGWPPASLIVRNAKLMVFNLTVGAAWVVLLCRAQSTAVMVSCGTVSYTHLTLPTKRIV